VNFSTFDLNLLKVLDALLREGSTVRAGERLGMSQSAVSGALSRLRHALGDELFVRHGQGLRATDHARALALPLRAELDRLEALLGGPPQFDPATSDLTFRLAGSDFFAEMLIPELAHRLGKRAPGMRVQLVDLVPANHIDTLEQYRADLVLMPDAQLPDWIETRPMFRSSFVVIARSGHAGIAAERVAAGDTLPLDLFCGLGHVLFSPEGRTASIGDAALAEVRRERRVVITLASFSGVCRVVAGSDHLALVPRQLAERLAPSFGLSVYRPPVHIEPPLILAAWHRRSSGNRAHAWMRGLIAEIFAPFQVGEKPL